MTKKACEIHSSQHSRMLYSPSVKLYLPVDSRFSSPGFIYCCALYDMATVRDDNVRRYHNERIVTKWGLPGLQALLESAKGEADATVRIFEKMLQCIDNSKETGPKWSGPAILKKKHGKDTDFLKLLKSINLLMVRYFHLKSADALMLTGAVTLRGLLNAYNKNLQECDSSSPARIFLPWIFTKQRVEYGPILHDADWVYHYIKRFKVIPVYEDFKRNLYDKDVDDETLPGLLADWNKNDKLLDRRHFIRRIQPFSDALKQGITIV